MSKLGLQYVAWDEYENIARDSEIGVPIEQSRYWSTFDQSLAGREPWGCYVARNGSEVRALISLSRYEGRGFSYLWAKHGPTWATAPTRDEEKLLRDLLIAEIRKRDRKIAFVRLHAFERNSDTRELLQTLTYDRTVCVDLTPSEDEILADMRQRGRRCIRKGLKDETLSVVERTGLDEAAFQKLYALLVETGNRDGFGINPPEVYSSMLNQLGSSVARIFVTEREERPLAWAIVTVYQKHGMYYYGASNAEGRKAWAADLLHWRIMQTLREEGVLSYDFMGIESDRAPQLRGVTEFKTKFAKETTPVAGAWDIPIRSLFYRILCLSLRLKRAIGR